MEKGKNKSLIIVIILLILIVLGIACYICYDKGVFDKKDSVNYGKNSEEKIKSSEQLQNNEEDDIYGYARMEYLPGDGSFNEYYRIVELHKNKEDKVLASYDVRKRGSVDKVNRIGSIKIIKNKIYYQLYYSSEDFGILTYNNIMYIDLNSENKEPVELLNWKQDSNNYYKTLRDFKITDDYVYFNTMGKAEGYEYYKYNIKTKEFTTITDADFETIKEEKDDYDWTLDKLYLNGKELLVNDKKLELIYDGETIYKSNAKDINLNYSFNGDIIIDELSNCQGFSCDIKYYKYNFDKKVMEEIDFKKNQIYAIAIWYK